MSFIEGARSLPKPGVANPNINRVEQLDARVKQLEETLLVIEEWFNDVFKNMNASAGSPECVDNEADLPPAAEAFGRIYLLMLGVGTNVAPHFIPVGKRVIISAGSPTPVWLALD